MIWLPVMFCDELAMLDVRLDEVFRWQVMYDPMPQITHVVVESPVTHRGVPKPLHYAESSLHAVQPANVAHVIISLPDAADPWVREHAQRDAAWPVIDAQANDSDWVLIGDVDEIPSASLLDAMDDLAFGGHRILPDPVAVRMRVFIHAVDWEVPQDYLPPQCVAATVGYIRAHGGSLAGVRDGRAGYDVVEHGGMHFSWLGTPEAQAVKLRDKTCHLEILGTAEAEQITSGERYRTGRGAGGLPVVPVTVDDAWPALIRDRRVPAEWFRP